MHTPLEHMDQNAKQKCKSYKFYNQNPKTKANVGLMQQTASQRVLTLQNLSYKNLWA